MTTARMPGGVVAGADGAGGVAHHHLAARLGLARAHDELEAHGHEDEQEGGEPAEQQPVDRLARGGAGPWRRSARRRWPA